MTRPVSHPKVLLINEKLRLRLGVIISNHSLFTCYSLSFVLISSTFGLGLTPHVQAQTANLSRLVVVGDSLSAGVQNLSLLDTQQPNGYAALIAKQAGVPLVLPLVKYPGAPNVLKLNGFDPLPVSQAVPGTLPAVPRVNPGAQPADLAEPGVTVAGALVPPASLPAPVGGWASIVLGSAAFPTTPLSQIQEAVALKPTTVIVWLGNNDALVPALIGEISRLTPVSEAQSGSTNPLSNFTDSFNLVIGALAQTNADLVVGNIPDVTEVPVFTSLQKIAELTGLPASFLATVLGTGTGDYLRSSALPVALDILIGKTRGPLPAICPAPYAGFPAPTVPCVLTASDAATVRSQVAAYNNVIAAAVANLNSARPHSAAIVDIHSLFDRIYANGYQLPGLDLNAGLLGGLFSLDGIHPTNTGYAILANLFIAAMNSGLSTNIPAVDV